MNRKAISSKILAAIFPTRCPFCHTVIAEGDCFCTPCAQKIPQITYQRMTSGGEPCCAPLPYRDAYAGAVRYFKFRKKLSYARPLAMLIAAAAARSYEMKAIDCVTCVPMYRKALQRRRFNHAEALARECAAVMGLPYVETLEKYRQNAPQHTLRRSERSLNVKDVYRVIDPSLVKGKRILLIDDIITTGSTLGECARMLKTGGCRRVICAVACTTAT